MQRPETSPREAKSFVRVFGRWNRPVMMISAGKTVSPASPCGIQPDVRHETR